MQPTKQSDALDEQDEADDGVVQIRKAHDPRRPALNTADTATRLGITRQAVTQAVHRGSLEGYGIAGESRTRWFVYEDAVEAREASGAGVKGELARLRERNRELEDGMATLLESIERRRHAEELMRESHDLGRQAQDRSEQAWSELSRVAATFESFLARKMVPSNVEDT